MFSITNLWYLKLHFQLSLILDYAFLKTRLLLYVVNRALNTQHLDFYFLTTPFSEPFHINLYKDGVSQVNLFNYAVTFELDFRFDKIFYEKTKIIYSFSLLLVHWYRRCSSSIFVGWNVENSWRNLFFRKYIYGPYIQYYTCHSLIFGWKLNSSGDEDFSDIYFESRGASKFLMNLLYKTQEDLIS